MKLVEVAPPDPASEAAKDRRPVNLLPGLVIGAAFWGGVYWLVRYFI